MIISFSVKGNPQSLKRHRMFRKGKSLIAVDPSQGDKADFLALAHQHAPEKPIDSPVRLCVLFTFSRPKNHYRTNGTVKPWASTIKTSKPDIDNLIKFILDSLNGFFWRDDCLVYTVEAVKQYGDSPGTLVCVEWDEKLDALRKVV